MAKNKTTETLSSVAEFLATIADETKRQDSFELIALIKSQIALEPKMWGANIIGFGSYHYQYESGHAGDAPIIAFSPRATAISLYLSSNFEQRHELLGKFGKYKAGKACIYIKKLSDIDKEIFKNMIIKHIKQFKSLYPNG